MANKLIVEYARAFGVIGLDAADVRGTLHHQDVHQRIQACFELRASGHGALLRLHQAEVMANTNQETNCYTTGLISFEFTM